jgi:hypothetical protein
VLLLSVRQRDIPLSSHWIRTDKPMQQISFYLQEDKTYCIHVVIPCMGTQTVSYLAELMKEPAFTKPQLLLHHFDHLLNLTLYMALHGLHPKSVQFASTFLNLAASRHVCRLQLLSLNCYLQFCISSEPWFGEGQDVNHGFGEGHLHNLFF